MVELCDFLHLLNCPCWLLLHQFLMLYFSQICSRETAGARFGDLQREIPKLVGEFAGPLAITHAELFPGSLMALGSQNSDNLGRDRPVRPNGSQIEVQINTL